MCHAHLTPELSRAAKRRRLERIVRPFTDLCVSHFARSVENYEGFVRDGADAAVRLGLSDCVANPDNVGVKTKESIE